ncbi:LysR family transcriptional regulator [uncultured Thalassospira sp.]|uniref:LysR family transcriptional regulator n=1 Tax=uncultured Thalassospira sp. TaxID=404382 RepID=UPI000E940296|nr:LysR family transcriptional regulator [uncultured Thalassospira sp.]HAY48239.1 LysR family transcriptional regulator [Thalassospira sp.]|tara:strand:+ start:6121 stop:7107 length:987 start_codon:yes stop_codon:yes gene_type:complete
MTEFRNNQPLSSAKSLLFRSGNLFQRGLKLSHLRMIVAMEETGQISLAADMLKTSQPAASRLLSEMETILEARLCVRSPRGIEMTNAGRALARRARSMLIEIREAEREIEDIKHGGGTVFVGAVTAAAVDLVVPAIRSVQSVNSLLEAHVSVGPSNLLIKDLLAGDHDFVIGRVPEDMDPRQFNIREIRSEKIRLMVRTGHPLLDATTPITLARLAKFEWILPPPGNLMRRTIEDVFISRHLPLPHSSLNSASLLVTLATLADTDAIAPMAEEVTSLLSSGGLITELPFDGMIEIKPYSLITARGHRLSPSAQLVSDHVLARIEKPNN